MSDYFDTMPKDDRERLDEYQRRFEYAKKRCAEAKFKRNLGEKLTQADENYLAFTPAPWGTAPTCSHT